MEKSRDCVAKYLGTDNIQYQRLSDNIGIIRNKIQEKMEEMQQTGGEDDGLGIEDIAAGETAEDTAEERETGAGEPAAG